MALNGKHFQWRILTIDQHILEDLNLKLSSSRMIFIVRNLSKVPNVGWTDNNPKFLSMLRKEAMVFTFWGVPRASTWSEVSCPWVTCYETGYTHDVSITRAPHTEILYNGDVFEWNIIEGRTVCFYWHHQSQWVSE